MKRGAVSSASAVSDFVRNVRRGRSFHRRDLFEQGKSRAGYYHLHRRNRCGRSSAGARALAEDDEREQTLNQLLVEWTGLTRRKASFSSLPRTVLTCWIPLVTSRSFRPSGGGEQTGPAWPIGNSEGSYQRKFLCRRMLSWKNCSGYARVLRGRPRKSSQRSGAVGGSSE